MLALVCGDKLADSCIYTPKFDSFAVQIDLRCLNFTEKLEEERLCISHQDLKVLLNGFLVDTVSLHEDFLFLMRAQRVVRNIKVDHIASPCFNWLTDNKAATC